LAERLEQGLTDSGVVVSELTVALAGGHFALAPRSMGETGGGYLVTGARDGTSRILASLNIKDIEREFLLAQGLRQTFGHSAELDRAEQAARTALDVAKRSGDPSLVHGGLYGLGFTCAQQGKFSEALDSYEHGVPLTDSRIASNRTAWPTGAAIHYAGCTIITWNLGFPDRARRRCEKMLDFETTISDPFYSSYYRVIAAMFGQKLRDAHAIHEHAGTARTLADDYAIPLLKGWSMLLLGWTDATMRGDEAACTLMREGSAIVRASGSHSYETDLDVLMAEASLAVGDTNAAIDAIEHALRFEADTGMRESAAEARRLKGRVLALDEGTPEQALDWFRDAITVAREQGARSLELRAAIDLSRCATATLSEPALHDPLRSVYATFTEGFDSADVRDAASRLHELDAGDIADGS
jgi:adenylate cyclase